MLNKMSDDSIRTRRVAELLKQEIASILANDIHDRRVHDVVITAVRVTKDLSIARVFFSSYDKESLLDIEIGLSKAIGFIRKKLTTSIHLKKLPQIIFERDTTADQAEHLDELFKQL
jgi:ribosome-binding factor A